jgi:hypothetical protein
VLKDEYKRLKEGKIDNFLEIIEEGIIINWKKLKRKIGKKGEIKREDWTKIKKDMENQKGNVQDSIINFIEKTTAKSRYARDIEEVWTIDKKKMKIYSDESAKDGKAAAGVWNRKYERLRTSFRAWGK